MPHDKYSNRNFNLYSEWHRKDSIKRFIAGPEIIASRLKMIDIDCIYIEAKHPYDRPPVALIETVQTGKRLNPQSYYPKSVEILYQLGKAANVPVFLVLYRPGNNTADNLPNIEEFYVKEQYPTQSKKWKVYTPEQYANFLVCLRQNHNHIKKNGAQIILPINDYLKELDDDDLERRWYRLDWERENDEGNNA